MYVCISLPSTTEKPKSQGTSVAIRMCVRAHSLSCIQLFVTPSTVDCQAPLSMRFFRQEYWSGLPFPPPGDLPDPGIETGSLMSPVLKVGSLPLVPPR